MDIDDAPNAPAAASQLSPEIVIRDATDGQADATGGQADALTQFQNEGRRRAAADASRVRRRIARIVASLLLALMALTGGLLIARSDGTAERTGTLIIESSAPGVHVRLNGRPLGTAPLQFDAAAGDHLLEFTREGTVRRVALTMTAGETVRQRIDFVEVPPAAPSVATRGALRVSTGVPVPVFVNGDPRGSTPVLIPDLEPGEHVVRVVFATGAVEQTVTVEPGATASVVVRPPLVAGAVSGWVRLRAEEPLQIFEGGQLLGTTEIERLMLPVGDHTLDLVNDELGFRTRQQVKIAAGRTIDVHIDLPTVPLAVNALPWASVWLDAKPVGETPIGTLRARIGRHEVVFRHPELGERRATVLVTLKARARIAVDLRTSDQEGTRP